jgi:hypothetical protein
LGGEPGHAIAAILGAHLDLPATGFILQVLPNVVELAKKCLPIGVQFQAHDFFTQNPVKGAKVYHIRACLHDWSDELCVHILRFVVSAMARDSRVLIAECLLPIDPKDDVGDLTALKDMAMLYCGGKERTVEEFGRIVEEAGLEIEKVWEGEKIWRFVVIECRLAG